MKALVPGATGFIGLPTAQAFVRKGHTVYGLVRTPEKARLLICEEITPILGDAADPSEWAHLITTVDVVIEALGGGSELPKLSNAVLDQVAEAAQKYRPADAPKVSYILTSGTWMHGDNRKDFVTDTTPITNPPPHISWRPPLEQRVIRSKHLNGIVVRPGMLYGGQGSLIALTMFEPASKGRLPWTGKPGGRLNLVHGDDLSKFYVLAAEKAQILGGKIIDVTNDSTGSVDEILAKVAVLSGLNGPEYVKPRNTFEEAMGVTSLVRPYLARALLGWQPRKPGLIEGMDTYYAAWKAIEETQRSVVARL